VDVEEMNAALIENWNRVVSPRDSVYHLGDFSLSRRDETVLDVMEALNGWKHLIIGNHDRDAVKDCHLWQSVAHYQELKLKMGGVHKQRIVMCHYAMRTWNQIHRGSWMLHGHSHGTLSYVGGKTMDVGVDVHGYAPISLDQVKAIMDARIAVYCDHHHS
jgi:calcineurin-like phosphoesterase family protein